ncbi:NAD(P)H-quinone oxidoreductase [Pengzhenrongella frigida]|uniref:NAD(P)H-quinone oxidoreductase n=1 Tax=Pengzhenrongella frigida TaxID=1259133 RepID=A0A4Q5N0L8_9MICO|nr:NAD(P)H-quinone oxidoreductase [Cellulomonas sp. HLT2-17]RYV51589.1 NAD(P)H-quinone oxidoreductase [Cellulomonas sp. HLT2-17]
MRAVVISSPGGPDVLVERTLPDPTPGRGEVLIDVAAAGVNRADLLQRQGKYPPPPGAPTWPGLEVSGTIAAMGPGAVSWSVGTRVCALLGGGGYADLVVAPAAQLLPVPPGLDLGAAAALPEAVCTAWSNLVDAGRLRAGEWVLVQGGSGGVGSVAIQLAVALGARVATTAGGPERTARCAALGAELVIDHRTQDVTRTVLEATGGRGVDVVLDVLGAGALAANLESLAIGGRLVVIGLQQGRRAELDLGLLLTRRASVIGTTLRARSTAEKTALVAALCAHAWPMLDDGRLRPIVHARIPFDRAREAHELLESGEVFGKVLLVP